MPPSSTPRPPRFFGLYLFALFGLPLVLTAFGGLCFILTLIEMPRHNHGSENAAALRCLFLVGLPFLCQVHLGLLALQLLQPTPRKKDWSELALPPKRLARLYQFVDEVAGQWRLPPPDEIRLGAITTAHVYETARGKRILVLGGVAVAALPQQALAAIVAHELAHFGAGDTSRHDDRGARLLAGLSHQLQVNPAHWVNPVMWVVGVLHQQACRRWAAHSQACEFAADAYAVEHAGPDVTGAALVYVHVADALPWANLSDLVETFVKTGEPTSRIFAEQAYLARRTGRATWQAACRKELAKRTGPLDAHPCLRARLRAMGISSRKALRLLLDESSPPARTLIDDWDHVEDRLGQKLTLPYRAQFLAKLELGQLWLGKHRGR